MSWSSMARICSEADIVAQGEEVASVVHRQGEDVQGGGVQHRLRLGSTPFSARWAELAKLQLPMGQRF